MSFFFFHQAFQRIQEANKREIELLRKAPRDSAPIVSREPLLKSPRPLVKRPSPIQGIGIFTTRDIKQGQIFYEIPVIKVYHEPTPRCAYFGDNTWVSDEEVLNYVNHSCNPNTVLNTDMSFLSIPHLYSLRPIKAREEITVDYDKTEKAEETRSTKVACNCHSIDCRGYFLIRQ